MKICVWQISISFLSLMHLDVTKDGNKVIEKVTVFTLTNDWIMLAEIVNFLLLLACIEIGWKKVDWEKTFEEVNLFKYEE